MARHPSRGRPPDAAERGVQQRHDQSGVPPHGERQRPGARAWLLSRHGSPDRTRFRSCPPRSSCSGTCGGSNRSSWRPSPVRAVSCATAGRRPASSLLLGRGAHRTRLSAARGDGGPVRGGDLGSSRTGPCFTAAAAGSAPVRAALSPACLLAGGRAAGAGFGHRDAGLAGGPQLLLEVGVAGDLG